MKFVESGLFGDIGEDHQRVVDKCTRGNWTILRSFMQHARRA